jgi:hypothetical protein
MLLLELKEPALPKKENKRTMGAGSTNLSVPLKILAQDSYWILDSARAASRFRSFVFSSGFKRYEQGAKPRQCWRVFWEYGQQIVQFLQFFSICLGETAMRLRF